MDHQATCDSSRAYLVTQAPRPHLDTSASSSQPVPPSSRRTPRRPVSRDHRNGDDGYGDDRLVTRLPHGSLRLKLLNSSTYEIVDSGTVRSIFSHRTRGVFCGFHSYSAAAIRPDTVYRHASAFEQTSALTDREMTWLSFDSSDAGIFIDCWTDEGSGLRVRDLKRAFRGIFQITASK
jgi:hypothetical protein